MLQKIAESKKSLGKGKEAASQEDIYNDLIKSLGTKLKKKMGWNEDLVYSNVWRKLFEYIFMRGCFVPLLVLASFLFKVAAALFVDVWLALMSIEYFDLSENTYFFVFLGITIFMIFFGYFRDIWFFSEM